MQTREAYAAARLIAAAGTADGGDAAHVARRLEDVLGLVPATAAVEARRCLLHQRDRRVHETLVLEAEPELLAELVAEIAVDGEDALRPAQLLVSLHYGPYSSLLWLRLARALGGDPPLAILVDRGLDPNLVLPKPRVRELEAAGVLPPRSFVAIEGPLAARNLARHLEAGGAALVFADAWIARRGVVARIGRRTLVLPRGVAWLAARTGCRIAGVLVQPVDDGHRVSVTAAPDVDTALARLLRSVEADPAPWEGWLRGQQSP